MIEMDQRFVISDIRRAVDRIGYCATAKEMHWRLMRLLREGGFSCQYEIRVEYFNGLLMRRGRIDILATRGHDRVGIELDRSTPRIKSILKLKGISDLTCRVVVLRSGPPPPCPEGIDAVLVAGQAKGDAATMTHTNGGRDGQETAARQNQKLPTSGRRLRTGREGKTCPEAAGPSPGGRAAQVEPVPAFDDPHRQRQQEGE